MPHTYNLSGAKSFMEARKTYKGNEKETDSFIKLPVISFSCLQFRIGKPQCFFFFFFVG